MRVYRHVFSQRCDELATCSHCAPSLLIMDGISAGGSSFSGSVWGLIDLNLHCVKQHTVHFLYVLSVFDFFLTTAFKLTLPLATVSSASVGSALPASVCIFMEAPVPPWSLCCLVVFIPPWSWCISAEDRIRSGLSSSRHLGDLWKVFLFCAADRCCTSGWICSGSGLLSSGGGSSTATRLATREDGSTAVTTRVTLRGKGAWRNTQISHRCTESHAVTL